MDVTTKKLAAVICQGDFSILMIFVVFKLFSISICFFGSCKHMKAYLAYLDINISIIKV